MAGRQFRVTVTAAGQPTWFDNIPELTWAPIAMGASATTLEGKTLASWQKGAKLYDVHASVRAVPSTVTDTIPASAVARPEGTPSGVQPTWTGSAGAAIDVETGNRRYYWAKNGGHTNTNQDGSLYCLDLNTSVPRWDRVVNPQYANDYATGAVVNNSAACMGDGAGGYVDVPASYVAGTKCASPRCAHGWYTPEFAAGRFWMANNTAVGYISDGAVDYVPQSTAIYSVAPYDQDPLRPGLGIWTWHGKGIENSSLTFSSGRYQLPYIEAQTVIYDPLGHDGAGASLYAGVPTIGTYRVLVNAPYTLTRYLGGSRFADWSEGAFLVPASATTTGLRYLFRFHHDKSPTNWSMATWGPTGGAYLRSEQALLFDDTASATQFATGNAFGYGGWHTPSNCFLFHNSYPTASTNVFAIYPSLSTGSLSNGVPLAVGSLNPSAVTSGAVKWRVRRIAANAGGWTPSLGKTPYAGGQAYKKCRLIPDMGNGRAALIAQYAASDSDVTLQPTFVYHIPNRNLLA